MSPVTGPGATLTINKKLFSLCVGQAKKKNKRKGGRKWAGGKEDESRGAGGEKMLAAFREMLLDATNKRARAPARLGFAHGFRKEVLNQGTLIKGNNTVSSAGLEGAVAEVKEAALH